MQRVRADNPDVLTYRSGSIVRALAAAIAAAGGVALVKAATLLPRDRPIVIGVLALFGLALVVGGILAALRALERAGIVLDRAHRRAVVWRRAVLPRTVRTRDLAGFWTVLLSPGRLQTRYASRVVYLVGLHGELGEPLLLHADADYHAARRFADEVARFLAFPLTDASTTEAVVYAPGQPPRPLPSAPPPAIATAPPPAPASRLHRHGETLLLAEPPVAWRTRIGAPLFRCLLLAAACAGLGAYGHFSGTNTIVFVDPLYAAGVVAALFGFAFLVIVVSGMPQLAQRRRVEVNRDGLRIRIAGPLETRDWAVRASDITELRIVLGHLCVITPRDMRVLCGRTHQPLPRAELEWLRDELWRALGRS